MTTALEALRRSVLGRTSSVDYLDGELVATPWDLADGSVLDIFVKRVDLDWYLVSDRGMIADRLGSAGVDVSRGVGARSWGMLNRGLAVTLAEASPFELAVTTTSAGLGQAISDVAARALQGDMLKVLGRVRHPRGFTERAMESASAHHLGVLPDPELRNRFGGFRKVSFLAEGDRGRCYVMALGGVNSFIEDHDRARLAFEDAQVGSDEKACIVANAAHPLPWHLSSLEAVAQVFHEDAQNLLWEKLEAA
jgi:hypothetical protein